MSPSEEPKKNTEQKARQERHVAPARARSKGRSKGRSRAGKRLGAQEAAKKKRKQHRPSRAAYAWAPASMARQSLPVAMMTGSMPFITPCRRANPPKSSHADTRCFTHVKGTPCPPRVCCRLQPSVAAPPALFYRALLPVSRLFLQGNTLAHSQRRGGGGGRRVPHMVHPPPPRAAHGTPAAAACRTWHTRRRRVPHMAHSRRQTADKISLDQEIASRDRSRDRFGSRDRYIMER